MNGTAQGDTERRPRNPLRERTPGELEEDVRRFHARHKLQTVVDVELLVSGALIGQDPANIAVRKLTEADRHALWNEQKLGFFQQTKALKVTILTTACAAIIQGWQQSTINASSLGWKCSLLVNHPEDNPNSGYRGSATDAVPWLSASIIGTWLSDPLQEAKFGRRPALAISAVLCVAFAIGTAHCDEWWQMLICRALLGVGVGAKASIAPVFAAEAAADHLRGRLLMMWQLFDTFGIFVGFVSYWITGHSWRVLLGSAALPAFVLLPLPFLCPESPRFLIRTKKYGKAYNSLLQLRGTPIQAARDLYYIHSQLQIETELIQGTPQERWWEQDLYQDEFASQRFFQRVKALLTVPRNRRACMAAFVVMTAQQLCGINVLSFYSTTVFSTATSPGRNSHTTDEQNQCEMAMEDPNVAWLNFGFGLANFLFTIPAYKFIDGQGRRVLLLISLGGMFFTLMAISGFFRISAENHWDLRLGLIAPFAIVIFTFSYGIGAGPVPFTFSAEVFPLAYREVGMSFSVMVNFLGLGLLVLFVPKLIVAFSPNHEADEQGHSNLLFFFTALNALAFVLVFFLVPSGTAHVSLEEMNYIFSRKTSENALGHLPGFINRRYRRNQEDEEPDDISLEWTPSTA